MIFNLHIYLLVCIFHKFAAYPPSNHGAIVICFVLFYFFLCSVRFSGFFHSFSLIFLSVIYIELMKVDSFNRLAIRRSAKQRHRCSYKSRWFVFFLCKWLGSKEFFSAFLFLCFPLVLFDLYTFFSPSVWVWECVYVVVSFSVVAIADFVVGWKSNYQINILIHQMTRRKHLSKHRHRIRDCVAKIKQFKFCKSWWGRAFTTSWYFYRQQSAPKAIIQIVNARDSGNGRKWVCNGKVCAFVCMGEWYKEPKFHRRTKFCQCLDNREPWFGMPIAKHRLHSNGLFSAVARTINNQWHAICRWTLRILKVVNM